MTNEKLESGGYKIAIVDPIAGIDIVREATPQEIIQIEAERALQLAEKEARQITINQAAADKAALLEKMGITEEEARLLLS